ncbi:hypothetical protein [Micromonospora sp. NPDC005979]|uniref:hypothetical protein n=1 Tax=Micromonospora sp. NPDC005979 TaxID=3156726 RepID=UPI0033A7E735
MGESPPPAPTTGNSDDRRLRTLAVIGVAANVLGVVTAVESWLKRDVLLFALTLTAVLVLGGFWLWRRRTRVAIALLALGCLLLGGVLATQLRHPSTPPPTAGAPSTSPPAAGGPTGAATPSASPAAPPTGQTTPTPGGTTDPDAPRTLVDRNVVLPRSAAVDVDQPDQPVVPNHSDGATDGLDLYHDWGDLRSDNIQVANTPSVYQYSGGNPGQAYAGCVASATGSARALFTPGADWCFRTSEGHLGFATITNDSRADKAFVVHVVVWDATGS